MVQIHASKLMYPHPKGDVRVAVACTEPVCDQPPSIKVSRMMSTALMVICEAVKAVDGGFAKVP